MIAGSTGYLGSHIVSELIERRSDFKAIARNIKKLKRLGLSNAQCIEAQITDKSSLENCCEGIDVVISALGITRQKDGCTYMDVDYQANKNLLEDAIKNGVKKFVYVSVLHGESLTHLKICEAKEKFVRALQESGLEYCIIRPSGFYSDMAAFYEMASKGRVYLFGDGSTQANPIHGADLAKVCVDAIYSEAEEIEVGGPDVLSHQDIAERAFQAAHRTLKITYIPDWIRRFLLKMASVFLSKARYGTAEFFLNVMAIDMVTEQYGHKTIQQFFDDLHQQGG